MKAKIMATKQIKTTIAVIGGGLAGLTMTACLAARGIDVVCVDPAAPIDAAGGALHKGYDGRTTAISYGSQVILNAAGIWDDLAAQACPIEKIQILDGPDSTHYLDFDSAEVEGRTFGWILENRFIRSALYQRIKEQKHARLIAPDSVVDFEIHAEGADVILKSGAVISCELIIGADGRRSFTREWAGIEARSWSYNQTAAVCTVFHENPHDHIAVEHFRSEGPFAILPMCDDENGRHRSSVVWTDHGGKKAKSPPEWADDVFMTGLAARFPAFYGALSLAGPRYAYPLGLVHAHAYTAPRMALVAEAAHGIHPIAGQGLNMGFRDIGALLDLIAAGDHEIGTAEFLKAYEKSRRFDNLAMAGATDGLNRLFSTKNPTISAARRLGMRGIARTKIIKRFFMTQAMGTAGILPAMIADKKDAA
jgi:2-octaprenyl-6-methoxyphenol hydroxylase